jgi:hypothetical protein
MPYGSTSIRRSAIRATTRTSRSTRSTRRACLSRRPRRPRSAMDHRQRPRQRTLPPSGRDGATGWDVGEARGLQATHHPRIAPSAVASREQESSATGLRTYAPRECSTGQMQDTPGLTYGGLKDPYPAWLRLAPRRSEVAAMHVEWAVAPKRCSKDLPRKLQAAILNAEQGRPKLRVVSGGCARRAD